MIFFEKLISVFQPSQILIIKKNKKFKESNSFFYNKMKSKFTRTKKKKKKEFKLQRASAIELTPEHRRKKREKKNQTKTLVFLLMSRDYKTFYSIHRLQ